jgi:hypothetical protein
MTKSVWIRQLTKHRQAVLLSTKSTNSFTIEGIAGRHHELCGAYLLSGIHVHIRSILQINTSE